MGIVIVTFTIMPKSPETDLDKVKEEATKLISEFGGEVGKSEVEPVAFGLKAVKLIFTTDEKNGGTDELEEKIVALDDVNSCEVTDIRRALG